MRHGRAAHLEALLAVVAIVAWLPQVARSETAPHRPPVSALLRPQGPLAPHTGALFGAWVDLDGSWTGNADAENEVATFESQLGRTLDTDTHYYAWTDTFPSGLEQWDLQHGRVPLISWKGTTLSQITNGSADQMIRQRARALAALGHEVFLRFAWEMNGNWYPWSGAQNGGAGTGPAAYVAAWRHIHDIFVDEGATNVVWVWSPNNEDTPNAAWNHWREYYPGNTYVDWVGIDGFNWGTTQSWSAWRSFGDIVRPLYADYADAKPIMVAETGSVEAGGDKAEWFTRARRDVEASFPSIAAFVYFHAPANWLATTSARAASAYRAWSEDPYFNSGSPGGGLQSPWPLVGGAFVWPQPVKDSTQVAFTLSHTASVSVEIRDSSGAPVRHLVTNRSFDSGTFAVTWDRKDDSRRKVGRGTYTAVVTAANPPAGAGQSSQSFQVR